MDKVSARNSNELKTEVDCRLGIVTPAAAFAQAEQYARHKLAIYQARYPEVDYYDDAYLVILTMDTLREQALAAHYAAIAHPIT